MDDIIMNDDDADQHFTTNWQPTQWISCGKTYCDVPAIVETARHHILKIPSSFNKNLPAKTMSIAQLSVFELPPVADDAMDDDSARFSDVVAISEMEEVLPFLAVPTRRTQRQLMDAFAKDRWLHAEFWLSNTGKTAEELEMKRMVQGLWKVIGWHGSLRGFAGIPVLDLASFFSEDYLGGNLVDAMLDLLTIIVNTTFAQFMQLLLPTKDGAPAISSNPGAQKYLQKYGTLFQSVDHTHLYCVLYRPPKHWTACSVDFQEQHIRYGDSLGWKRPRDSFLALDTWTEEHFAHAKFTVTNDLPCTTQTDSFNCPIISVNAFTHNTLGDPLWTSETAKAMRMRAFSNIAKYSLSTKRMETSKRQIVDPTDLSENLLAWCGTYRDLHKCSWSKHPMVLEGPVVDVPIPGTRGVKRAPEAVNDGDERKKKLAKLSESLGRHDPAAHPSSIPVPNLISRPLQRLLRIHDTKLFPALRPLYDGVKQKWFIVGTTGEPIEVPNVEGLHKTLDELETTAELATKIRLWVLQIPLPGVPTLVWGCDVSPTAHRLGATAYQEPLLRALNDISAQHFCTL
ncbi:hypothetical protein B0H10DRAFT_1962660 [Mycena sp. CBHHK59/15]|nr:hypothetical protein B0H10DRAFT_1962660 [Mycena sp. CBHHK59/15]